MSVQIFKSDFYCVVGRHRCGTKNVYGDIASSKVSIGYCSICNRKKIMTVSGNTIQPEGLSSFFKNVVRIYAKAGKNLATNVSKNQGRSLEITANITTAAATKSPKTALSSLPEVIDFYNTGRSLYLGKLV